MKGIEAVPPIMDGLLVTDATDTMTLEPQFEGINARVPPIIKFYISYRLCFSVVYKCRLRTSKITLLALLEEVQ